MTQQLAMARAAAPLRVIHQRVLLRLLPRPRRLVNRSVRLSWPAVVLPRFQTCAENARLMLTLPPSGKKRSSGQALTAGYVPKSISPTQRAREFPDEPLVESGGKLFCRAYRETLCVKRSVVSNHVKSSKHDEGKKKLKTKQAREADLALALEKHDSETHRKGETLPESQKVYRAKVVIALMEAGIPLSKLDCPGVRELLEENSFRLTDSRHMMDMIPFILQKQRTQVRDEIQEKDISIIFDGTTRLGEVLVVVDRFLEEWTVKQRLVSVQFLQKSVNGDELARSIISVLSVSLGIESGRLLAVMRDGASVNAAALRTVAIVYPSLLDVCCISHTLDLVGDKFKAPTVSLFFTLWVSLFAHSAKVKAKWRERTGRAMATYSKTRWWSRWEIMQQVLEQFGDVEPFLQDNADVSAATRAKLLEILHDPQQLLLLKVELAAIVDMGVHFVRSTYSLEGDGLLVIKCYEEISKIRAVITSECYPNLQGIVRSAFPGDLTSQHHWTVYAKHCMQSGIEYFQKRLGDDEVNPVKAFKAARFFSPSKMNEMQPTTNDIDQLQAFPFLLNDIDQLKAEIPSYLAHAADVSSTIDTLRWWEDHRNDLPAWSSAVRKVSLLQPSSAAAERVFSLLTNTFGDKQQTSLSDYVEASLMVQYNKK